VIRIHEADCPEGTVEHIAAIEAGWTLPKPWKMHDEDRGERENIEDVAAMLARWKEHGIIVTLEEGDTTR
jgi:hypothetical protein